MKLCRNTLGAGQPAFCCHLDDNFLSFPSVESPENCGGILSGMWNVERELSSGGCRSEEQQWSLHFAIGALVDMDGTTSRNSRRRWH